MASLQPSRIALGIAAIAATGYSFYIPPAKSFKDPDLARIICFHLPCAFITTGLLFLTAWFGFRYLKTRSEIWDVRTAAATELGAIFGTLTMLTGILFSRVQWGPWWQWDPRQTSFLFVLLLLVAGLALRAGLADEAKRASAGAAYALGTLIPAIFLIFVYPRLPYVQQVSFHPSATIQSGGFDGNYWSAILLNFIVITWATVVVYRMRIQSGMQQWESHHAELDAHLGGAAPTGVVKPVSVRDQSE